MRSSLIAITLLAGVLAACSSQPPAPEQKPAAVEERQATESAPVTSETVDPYSLAAL